MICESQQHNYEIFTKAYRLRYHIYEPKTTSLKFPLHTPASSCLCFIAIIAIVFLSVAFPGPDDTSRFVFFVFFLRVVRA